MPRLLVFAFCFLFSLNGFAQYPYRFPTTRTDKYTVAMTFANPLSSYYKSGGGVEHRYGNFSYMSSYYIYRGAYPGGMADLDLRSYFKRRWKVSRNSKWIYQDFLYFRSFYGIAAFDSKKIEMFGYPEDVIWEPEFFYGASSGYGRRFSNKNFFVTLKLGLRGTQFLTLDENGDAVTHLSEEAKPLYKLFYISGPGSIVEFNVQWGIQF